MPHKDAEKRKTYHRERQRAYLADPETRKRVNAQRRSRAAMPENKEKISEQNRRWREQKAADGLTKSISWQRTRRREKPVDYLLFDAKRRAEKKGVTFSVSAAERLRLEEIVAGGQCEVTRLAFVKLDGTRNPYSPSMDRIKPELGYVDGNIRVVIWALNMALGEWGMDVLLRLARAIVDANPETGV